jgi:(p)ppGpp synthase/HD superfamily hydrolase
MIIIHKVEIEEDSIFGDNPDEDFNVLTTAAEKCLKDLTQIYNYTDSMGLEHEISYRDLIKKAYYYNLENIGDLKRMSGQPYYIHPLKACLILINEIRNAEIESIIAAILHDLAEDIKEITLEMIQDEFGLVISNMCDALMKIKHKETKFLDKASTYEKLFKAFINDYRIILVKLADRLDNMRTLQHLKDFKQTEISTETLNFYVPFAYRLGLLNIKIKLEDLSLYFLDPIIYSEIKQEKEIKKEDIEREIMTCHEYLSNELNNAGLNHVITAEHKHFYEISRIISEGTKLSDISNFYSMKIIIFSTDYSDCYRAYGILVQKLKPVYYYYDYITQPKINLYRAIHATVNGPHGKRLEVIIRTAEMDDIAERGAAANLNPAEFKKSLNIKKSDVENWIAWLRDSVINEGDENAMQKIWGSIRSNLYENEIIVHTSKIKDIQLPHGSTIIDLAFNISEKSGLSLISAKVNDVLKDLKYELQNNDYVELIHSEHNEIGNDWIDSVVTIKALTGLYKYYQSKQIVIPEIKIEFPKDVKFRITGDDRTGILIDITNAIGQLNIQRINLSSTNALFEGAFTVAIPEKSFINTLYVKLLGIKGLKGVEILED